MRLFKLRNNIYEVVQCYNLSIDKAQGIHMSTVTNRYVPEYYQVLILHAYQSFHLEKLKF